MEKQIFGQTDGIRGKAGEEPLTEKTMTRLGWALGRLSKQGVVLIGRDTRESGGWIVDCIKAGLSVMGMKVVDCGILPTPALAILVKERAEAIFGIMVTASHNPADDNGVKVFNEDGDKLSDEMELEIEDLILAGDSVVAPAGVMSESVDSAEVYVECLRRQIGMHDLGKKKILVDSAAGAAFSFSKKVWSSLGVEADEVGAVPDGRNINLNCGALYPEKLAELMAKSGAELGVALDGDADRVILADGNGRLWDGDRILAALARWLRQEGKLINNTVVLTEYSNLGAIKYLETEGIKIEKVVNGDKEVLRKCREVGAVLGAEVSGHIIYLPWLSSSDGTMVATWFVAQLAREGKRLADVWPDYEVLPSRQWGIFVKEKRPLEEVLGWEDELGRQRAMLGNMGRIFVRYSGTENKLRILVEAADDKIMNEAGDKLSEIIKKEIGL